MSDNKNTAFTIADYKTAYQSGGVTPERLLSGIWQQLDQQGVGPEGDPAWIYLPTPAQRQALLADLARKNPENCPLWGIPFAVKDNIDIGGWPTTAACPEFTYVASQHATVISALLDAGAIPMGKTNLDQFATGLVGTRSPYGWVPNTFSHDHISGGSSSGSASVTARGLVCFALGTDTAGSGRIPAGFNNLVGTKPTPGLLSTQGVVPACQTVDCVSIMTLTVADASRVLNVLEKHCRQAMPSEPRFHAPVSNHKFAFPRSLRVGVAAAPRFTDLEYEACYRQALDGLRQWNIEPVPVDMETLDAIAAKLYSGPWVAERYVTARSWLTQDTAGFDPSVKKVISAAEKYSAADAFEALYEVRKLAALADAVWQRIDVLLVPTAAGLPTHQALVADPLGANSALGRYTNFVNLMGWAALATPAGMTASGLPFGVTWIAPGGTDHALLALGQQWMDQMQLPLGHHLRASTRADRQNLARPYEAHAIAVVGAHLSGMPLNGQLQAAGARLAQSTTTSANYRLYALPNTTPPKPGLVRVDGGGQEIAVEVYDVPRWAVSGFLDAIPSPLGLGRIELASGQWVTGFICEPLAVKGARDITEFGGWRAYMAELAA